MKFVNLKVDDKTKLGYLQRVSKILDNGNFILGRNVEEFEKCFASYIGVKLAIGVGNGTDAIRLALRCLGIRPGDKVLTVSFSSPFTAIAICEEGAVPVFCDIDENTWTIDIKDAIRKTDSKTKAIVPVHIYGNPCDMDKILDFAKHSDLKVVEDACQAHGAKYKNKMLGSYGDAGAFSFYPTKNLGALGDAGAVVLKDKRLSESLKSLRNGGQTERFWHENLGINSRLDELQAAFLNIKLKSLDRDNNKRANLANRYKEAFTDLPIIFQASLNNAKSSNHLFSIRVKSREALSNYLKRKKIPYDIYYPFPIHTQKAFRKFKQGQLKVTENISKEIISLPLYPSLTFSEQDKIIYAVRKFYKKK